MFMQGSNFTQFAKYPLHDEEIISVACTCVSCWMIHSGHYL